MNVVITVDDLGSLGRLTKSFLYDDPLAPLRREISQAVDKCELFSEFELKDLFLIARINRRDKAGHPIPSGVAPDAGWKLERKESSYIGDFDFNLAALVAADKKREVGLLLSEALSLLRSLSIQATAQAAVELRVEQQRIDHFLRGFSDVDVALQPPRKAAKKRPTKTPVRLDVQILHQGGAPSDVLQQRAALRECLEGALEAGKLGSFDGSSSGEFHFEFGFLVSDASAAIEVMRVVLTRAGVPAERIGFEVIGSQE